MKKILALLLVVCTIGWSFTGVFAYSDVENGTYVSEAISVLSGLGILEGYEDDTFKPDATVTRAEMAKIICETLNYDFIGSNKTPFDDVEPKHWASGYINTAYAIGTINGYGDGKFGPEDTVTYEQAVKMVVCALGYEPMAANKGGWPAGYTSVAANIGLVDHVSGSTRGDIAALIYNALNTPVMEQTSYGVDSKYEILDGTGLKSYKSILTKQDIYIATGIVSNKIGSDKIAFDITKNSKDKEFAISESNEIFYIGNSDVVDYIYQEVEAYVAKIDDEYTVLTVKPGRKSETFTLISDDIKQIEDNRITYYTEGSKTKSILVDENVVIEYNEGAVSKVLSDFITEDIELVFIENDGDKSYDVIVATEYTSEVLSYVDAEKDKMTLGGKTVVFDFEDEDKVYIFTDDKGNELSLADFEIDDVIAYIANNTDIKAADYIKIIKLADSVIEGAVDSVYASDNSIVVDGNKYKVVSSIWNEVSAPGTEGKFYIGITGKIVYFDGSQALANYGYILNSYVNTEFDETVIVKILTKNGVKKYNLTDKMAVAFNDKYSTKDIDWVTDLATVDTTRFVKYKINSKDEISSFEWLTIDDPAFINKEYNADTEILNGKYIDKNTIIFVINEEDENDVYVTNMKFLVDEGIYSGATYTKVGDTAVLFITSTDTAYNSEMGFAIVTGVSHVTDSKSDDVVFAVDYVQNEVEDTIYFNEITTEEEAKFAVGTVFAFNIGADDYVNKYAIVANIIDNAFDADETTNITTAFGTDVEVIYGYIENDIRKVNTKGELITVNGVTYVVGAAANKYTYVDTHKTKIEIEDFLGGDAYYADEDYKTPVMLKLVDGVVIDIYTISARIPK